jgi:phospholipase/carboxylesterase
MASQIELPPASGTAEQLFVLLHGVGGTPESMLPVAHALQRVFPQAAIVAPQGFDPFDAGGEGRQWFSIKGIDEASRPARVAAVLPRLIDFVRQQQDRWKAFPMATALVGFSQGAIVSLEAIAKEDGLGGRVLAFSGRYAALPGHAPRYTTIHLFHGDQDEVIPVAHAKAALEHLAALNGDVTLDIAHGVGHVLHPVLIDLAIERLRGRIPLRSWQRALGAVIPPGTPAEGG